MRDLLPCPPCGRQGRPDEGVPGRLEYRRAAGERPPRARPQRRGSPGPIPNPAVKPAFAESTAARGCGRAGRRARGGRFSISAVKARRGYPPCGPYRVFGHFLSGAGSARRPARPRSAFRLACAERRRPAGAPLRAFPRFYGAEPIRGRLRRPRRLRDRREKGPLRIVREPVAKPPAPANPLNGRCPRTPDGRISCAQRSQRDSSLRACFAFGVGFSVGFLQSKCCDLGFAISSADPCS